MRHADPSTPAPRQLSDEERALWEKADAARQAMEAVTQPFTLTTTAHDRGLWSLLGEGEYTAANALCQLAHACNPAVILSLLTALSSERTRADRWKTEAEQWEEREANCCPEDMSMEENIGALIRERDEARGALSTEREAGEKRATDAARAGWIAAKRETCPAWVQLGSCATCMAQAIKLYTFAAPSTETPHA